MDNFNNIKGQQDNPYGASWPQYNTYGNSNYPYNPQSNSYNQPMGNGYSQPMGYAYTQGQPNQSQVVDTKMANKKKLFNLSAILGLVGGVLLLVGLLLPAIDLSHFHQEVDIQYNLFKVGKNVGLLSSMWNIIPYVILIGILLIVVLSFVKIPVLKVLPVLLIICMFVLMLVDMENVVTWASDLLERFDIVLETEITIGEIFKSLMPGVYIMVVGLLVSLVSCFVKIKNN